MIRSTAHSIRAAWANTRATGSRDPDSGQPRPFTRRRRILAGIGAIIWVLGPGVTIETWHDHASGRLTSARVARTTFALAAFAFPPLMTVAWFLAATDWFYLCIAVLVAFIIPLVVSAEVVVSARRYPREVSHILTDVVRHPDAPAGSGAALVEALAADATRVVGAEARNNHLWLKIYSLHATSIEESASGKTRFLLRPRVQQPVG